MLKQLGDSDGENTQYTTGRFECEEAGVRFKVVHVDGKRRTVVATYTGPDAQHFATLTTARLNGQL